MTTCLVRLNGQNVLVDRDEGPGKKRFRSTRLVGAENQNRAVALARELICNDPRLRKAMPNEESDPPAIHLARVSEVPAMAYDAQNRANSFDWENEYNE